MEGDIGENLVLYPALERNDPDRSFDQIGSGIPSAMTFVPLSAVSLTALHLNRHPQLPAEAINRIK
jgi:hypothetical protein